MLKHWHSPGSEAAYGRSLVANSPETGNFMDLMSADAGTKDGEFRWFRSRREMATSFAS